jgi:uncharacterized protein YbbC (DUF1343 family)
MNQRNLPGARFRQVYFTPTFNKYKEQLCEGIHIYVTDRNTFRPVQTTLHLLAEIIHRHPDQFDFNPPLRDSEHLHFDLLSGSAELRHQLSQDTPVNQILAGWEEDLANFAAQRANFLLYEA